MVSPDGIAAPELRRLSWRRERVGQDAVGGEQVGEGHSFPCHHLADLLGNLARRQRHGNLL
jgi:hypothetical protein